MRPLIIFILFLICLVWIGSIGTKQFVVLPGDAVYYNSNYDSELTDDPIYLNKIINTYKSSDPDFTLIQHQFKFMREGKSKYIDLAIKVDDFAILGERNVLFEFINDKGITKKSVQLHFVIVKSIEELNSLNKINNIKYSLITIIIAIFMLIFIYWNFGSKRADEDQIFTLFSSRWKLIFFIGCIYAIGSSVYKIIMEMINT